MEKEIRRINPWTLAKFMAGFWLSLGLVGTALLAFGWMFGLWAETLPGPLILSGLIGTAFYSVVGYFVGLLWGWVYNLIASAFGGIRVELDH